jgi:hypothetical protein
MDSAGPLTLAARFPVKHLSLMHWAKFTIWISHPMKIYKLQHILLLSFNIWNVYFCKKTCISNTTAVIPTDNYSQGKCPLKEGLLIAFNIRLPGKLSSRHTVGSGCQISMTHFLMFDRPTHSQINSCLKIYRWQNTHVSVTAHQKRGDMRWAYHQHSSTGSHTCRILLSKDFDFPHHSFFYIVKLCTENYLNLQL